MFKQCEEYYDDNNDNDNDVMNVHQNHNTHYHQNIYTNAINDDVNEYYDIDESNSENEANILSIDCYCDASYSKEVGGSVIAYKIGNLPIRLSYLDKVKNTEAEIQAVDKCIEIVSELYGNENFIIYIHTDCQKVIELKNEEKYQTMYLLIK